MRPNLNNLSGEKEALSLLELNTRIRGALSRAFPETCWVRAEMSDVRVNTSSGSLKGNLRVPAEEKAGFWVEDEPLHNEYGYSYKQIKMLNGTKLHEAGFRGEGMRVAVIDAGFMNADRVSAFDSLRLLGTHNVVFPGKSTITGRFPSRRRYSGCDGRDCPLKSFTCCLRTANIPSRKTIDRRC